MAVTQVKAPESRMKVALARLVLVSQALGEGFVEATQLSRLFAQLLALVVKVVVDSFSLGALLAGLAT